MTIAKYRNALPQMGDARLLTDSGLETTLVYHDGIDLPQFAAFHLLRDDEGCARLAAYFDRHAAIATSRGLGFIADTPTWRASSDWGDKLGYTPQALAEANRKAVRMMFEVRDRWERPATPVVVSGNMGPRGDGYVAGVQMSADEAKRYHARQVGTFEASGVDMISVLTMTYAAEAVGVSRAGAAAGVPVALSFTVETDGRLPSGQPLGEAVEEVDACGAPPTYFMINCAHPEHFLDVLRAGGDWTRRIRGIRANASRLSHAELEASTELDDGDPHGLGQDYAALQRLLPDLRVFGGCCGTDHRHVEAMAEACCGRIAA